MKIVLKTLAIFLIARILFAAGGSVYSRYGVGDLVFNYSARRMGMGNLGLALLDKNFVSGINPASWSKIDLTRSEASVSFIANSIANSQSSFLRRTTYFNGIAFAVPIQRDYGIVTSFGILPYSKVNYDVEKSFTANSIGNYKEEFKGQGGISKFFIGSSVKLPYDFSFGATFEYYFGKIEYYSNLVFPDTSSLRNVGYIQNKSILGIGATVGLISPDLNDLLELKSFDNIRIGVVYSPQSKVNTDTTVTTNNLIGANQVANGLTKTVFPAKYGIGFSFVFNNNFLFTFDYLEQKWSDYEFANKKSGNLSDYFKFGFGVEYSQKATRFSSFWEQVRYRCGLSYQKTPYRISGEDIYQYDVSGGVSFPLGFANSIDVAVLGGIRGTKENNLLEEKFVEARISLSFGERWFVRRKR